MSLLEHEKAIEQYYERVKDKYPDIDFERFRLICRSPFETVKKWMKDGMLPLIMIKHLGKFIPMKGRVVERLKVLDRLLAKNIIDQDDYDNQKQKLENYLKDFNNEPPAEIEDDTE